MGIMSSDRIRISLHAAALAAVYAIAAPLLLSNGASLDAWAYAVLLAICLVWLSSIDLAHFTVPSLATVAVTVLGALHLLQEKDWHSLVLWSAFAGVLTALFWLLGEVLYRRLGEEGFGIGDAKLIGAATLWVGPLQIWMVLFLAASGGIVAACLSRNKEDRRVPFAPFLAFSLFILVLHGMDA